MSKPIKAIVCGAGDMARKHIEAYRKLDNVEIAAVASRSIPRAAALSAAYDIPRYYDDIDDAFGQEVHCYRSEGIREIVHDLKENGHETIIRKFVESVELNSEVPVQPQEAIEALKIPLAALKSIETGVTR